MSTIKTFSKGDVIVKEGERAQYVYLIQSGAVSVYLPRNRKNVELYQLSSGSVIGDQILWGVAQYNANVMALTETKLIELPAEALKAQVEASPQLPKLLIKALSAKIKTTVNDLKSFRLERDPSPCPQNLVPKVFGGLFYIARHIGKVNDLTYTVDWKAFRQYSERVLMEPTKRMENAVYVLVKLKLAELEYGKLEEADEGEGLTKGQEVLLRVKFLNLARVEEFFDFYQYYYYKSGKMDILKVDELAYQIVGSFNRVFSEEKPDRQGKVSVSYQKALEAVKAETGITLNNDHFSVLERKGLIVGRTTGKEGPMLTLLPKEFQQMYAHWQILREVEMWNEKGSVDPKEEAFAKVIPLADLSCPSCKTEFKEKPKFCPNCGTKLAAA